MSIELQQSFVGCIYESVVSDFPGCPQLGVSHGLALTGDGGYGKRANLLRQTQIKKVGYNAAICTIESNNVKQTAILEATGWSRIASFYNTCTENTVEVWFNPLGGKTHES